MQGTAKLLLVGTALAAASMQASACYTVFDRAGRVAYQGTDAPVDMSLPLHRALEQRFPGGHMVFQQDSACAPVAFASLSRPQTPAAPPNTAVLGAARATGTVAAAPNTAVMGAGPAPNTAVMGAGPAPAPVATRAAAAPVSNSPLLTDKQTAEDMQLPYRDLGGGVVLVPAGAAARVSLNTMTIIPPAVGAAPAAPNTAMMGAGPAVPNTAVMGAGPAPSQRSQTVITEMRNPPVTVIQRDGKVTVLR